MRRHHARRLAHRFHRFLEGDGVEDGGEHAHVVGGGAGDVAFFAEGRAADEISAADDDGELDAGFADVHQLAGDAVELIALDARAALRTETFAADLQEHTLVGRAIGHGRGIIRVGWSVVSGQRGPRGRGKRLARAATITIQ